MNCTLFYRITEHSSGHTLVYATDTEPFRGGNQALIGLAQGADLLIHDSQYTEEQYRSTAPIVQGFGHSDYKSAVEVAAAAGVRQRVLTHFDPRNGDEVVRKMEQGARAHAATLDKSLRVTAAREGTTIDC